MTKEGNNSPAENNINKILDFWFKDLSGKEWFAKSDELDKLITQKFGVLHAQAIKGELDDWQHSPEGTLALIILIDQFSRNIYRNDKRSFQYDDKALGAAKYAVDTGFDDALDNDDKRLFMYMPFMHSEDLAVQEESLKVFKALGRQLNYEYAVKHYDVIKEFGRFPHRNGVLGRRNTPQEDEYLAKPGAGF